MERPPTLRETLARGLENNRLFQLVEILLVIAVLALSASGSISTAVIFLFVLASLSLWLRRRSWWQLGLRRPPDWGAVIGYATLAGMAYQGFSIFLLTPLLERLTGRPIDLSQFEGLQGDPTMLVTWLLVAWVIAALGEEMVYRGYLLNRLADLFGSSRAGWLAAVLLSSAFFAAGHLYQGISGLIETFLFAVFMAGLYLWGRRSLWLVIIAHGVYDTVGFLAIYLGIYS